MSAFDNTNGYTELDGTIELSKDDVYDIALKFFKENKEKAFHLTYENRMKMTSLINYVKYGNYDDLKTLPEFGMFDFVGKDIIRRWRSLAKSSVDEAKINFVTTLESFCPEFEGFLQAVMRHKESEEEIRKERQKKIEVDREKDEELRKGVEEEGKRRLEQEYRLREVLNQQTLPQFREYAIQQHPDDVSEQERLIAQLQQHHFHQYMLAVYENATTSTNAAAAIAAATTTRSASPSPSSNSASLSVSSISSLPPHSTNKPTAQSTGDEQQSGNYTSDMVEQWCGRDINQFKTQIRGLEDGGDNKQLGHPDSILKIGSGEIVTIKVPGSPINGSNSPRYLEWQFATDDRDIGFGLSVAGQSHVSKFEADQSQASQADTGQTQASQAGIGLSQVTQSDTEQSQVSQAETGELQASQAETDELQASQAETGELQASQVETGQAKASPTETGQSQATQADTGISQEVILLPVSRRDSHINMHGGRLRLLSQSPSISGCAREFLLKFDNSYSLWRHKTLYYRVCFTTGAQS